MTFSIEKLKARKKRHYLKHKDYYAAYNKEYQAKHKIYSKEYHRQYQIVNRDKIMAYRRTSEYKAKRRVQDNAHYARTKERHRELWASKKYGITIEDYRKLSLKDSCDICGQKEIAVDRNKNTKRLAIDHNHETGKVRGMLCQRCNQAIGLLREDIELIEKVKSYLNGKN